jgi:ABC-type transport system involved in cytochrome bd biosynthesis fused ATPase/permease subunit
MIRRIKFLLSYRANQFIVAIVFKLIASISEILSFAELGGVLFGSKSILRTVGLTSSYIVVICLLLLTLVLNLIAKYQFESFRFTSIMDIRENSALKMWFHDVEHNNESLNKISVLTSEAERLSFSLSALTIMVESCVMAFVYFGFSLILSFLASSSFLIILGVLLFPLRYISGYIKVQSIVFQSAVDKLYRSLANFFDFSDYSRVTEDRLGTRNKLKISLKEWTRKGLKLNYISSVGTHFRESFVFIGLITWYWLMHDYFNFTSEALLASVVFLNYRAVGKTTRFGENLQKFYSTYATIDLFSKIHGYKRSGFFVKNSESLEDNLVLKHTDLSYSRGSCNFLFKERCFEKGKVYAIKGASGVGKSTYLKCLVGLEGGIDGIVTFNKDISLGYISQGQTLFDGLIRDNFEVFSSTMLARVLFELELTTNEELATFLQRSSSGVKSEVSGGQAQRLALAREILAQPDVLFLDEAISGLDPSSIKQLFSVFKGHLPNTTIILISHQSLENVDEWIELS